MNSPVDDDPVQDIAIIGLYGRFPGAGNVDAFWRNLRNGVESISWFTDDELEASGIDAPSLRDPHYVKAGAVLEDVDLFDASFFGYSPREAEGMDPQQRLFLEGGWAALETAGYNPECFDGAIGVYAGVGLNTYLLNNILAGRTFLSFMHDVQTMMGSDKDFLTTRISYQLGLTGPSVVVQATCSTSLVAVCQACQSLRGHVCDMALAGGVTVRVPQQCGYHYQPEAIFSPDGHCRTFDARAEGTIFGSGLGIVVLRRLADALTDGDTIHAVIRGWAVNNDGAMKVGYTAPSVDGQAEVIAKAQVMAGVHPETISYIEAHGTATALGDPIEIAALTRAFRAHTDKRGFCAIGAVKSNVGHLDTAAGIASLIKTVLSLEQGMIPPSLHFERPNPNLDLPNSPFYVNATLSDWIRAATPRRAGVSSFGIGGTNAHVVLEEAPEPTPSTAARPVQLLVLSAKTDSALETATDNLATHFKQNADVDLADATYTLQVGRRAFNHRRMLVCRSVGDTVTALETRDPKQVLTRFQEPTARLMAFMFPGQGAQYVNMGLEVYETEPVFREHVDSCSNRLQPHLGIDLRKLIYPSEEAAETAAQQLKQTRITQPALFVIEYALAQLWMSWGVRPQAMIGHSIGEYVAACLAGVFSLDDCLAFVSARGRLMQELPAGAMLAVPLPAEQVQTHLGGHLSLAAINGPSLCVVSGPTELVGRLDAMLAEKEISCRPLETSHAFHSTMMDPILPRLTEEVRRISLRPPRTPFISNMTGTWITEAQATDPDYWVRHVREPVRFATGVKTLLEEPSRVLLEVGPGRTLCSLATQSAHELKEQQGNATDHVIVSSTRHPQQSQSDVDFLLSALGRLWLSGIEVNWAAFHSGERRHRIPLPTYPFERRRYWIEPQRQATGIDSRRRPLTKRQDMAKWFYVPSWRRSADRPMSPRGRFDGGSQERVNWLVFCDAGGLGEKLATRLEQRGQRVVAVSAGSQFAQLGSNTYTLNPQSPEDYETLVRALRSPDKRPSGIVHLWSVGADHRGSRIPDRASETDFTTQLKTLTAHLESAQERGFYSLQFLFQALGRHLTDTPLQVLVVTDGVHDVTGDETLCPKKATVSGVCKVIPRERPLTTCRHLDIVLPPSGAFTSEQVDRVIDEVPWTSYDPIVAHRGPHRWVRTVESVPLEGGEGRRPALRQGGVYLITGGLGGIGLVLAEYLARSVQARLVLTGRRGLPPEGEWSRWLDSHDQQDETHQRIQKVRALEAAGAEVLVAAADVACPRQMQDVIRRSRARFGDIHGVIHAAGIAKLVAVQESTRELSAAVLAPKLQGTCLLDALCSDMQLDFLVFCSSLASMLGSWGQSAYCAANAFLDTFAHCKRRNSATKTVSINWDSWREVGMGLNMALPTALSGQRANMLKEGLLSGEGVEAFDRILRSALPQVLVSTRDLPARLDEEMEALSPHLERTATEHIDSSPPPTPAEPSLSAEESSPRNDIELTIADSWRQLLGIERLGIHDNFFEVGGNSLVAIQLLNRLREHYEKVDLSLRKLFDQPTVAGLASLIAEAYPSARSGSVQTDATDGSAPSTAEIERTIPADRQRSTRDQLVQASPEDRPALIRIYLKEQVAQLLDRGPDQVPEDDNLEDFDATMIAAHLTWALKRDLGLPIYPDEIRDRLSIKALAGLVAAEFERLLLVERGEWTPGPVDADRQELLVDGSPPPAAPARKNPTMVFVFCSPRSGSTLLRIMLSGHSKLFCPPELHLLDKERLSEWSRDRFSYRFRDGLLRAFMSLMNTDVAKGQAFVDDLIEQNLSTQDVYRLLQERASPRTLVDKTPAYALKVHTMQSAEYLFEKPKYILLVRHPYAMIDSFVRSRFDKIRGVEGDPYAIAEKYWTQSNGNMLELSNAVDEHRCHFVRYEELVTEPGVVMRALCVFLGISFEEGVLHPYENGKMFAGPGDPNIFDRREIETRLGNIWKQITLPRALGETATRLATTLGYELPSGHTRFGQRVIEAVKAPLEPFFFGGGQVQRFGCYHFPSPADAPRSAVVLCYPFGHEYIRAHRSYRLLATRLAEAGYPVLRFDNSGCGDSGGGLEDAGVQIWLDDISEAIDAVTKRAGPLRVCLVGARLGAALAAMAGARRDGVAAIVLWDSVISGGQHLEELAREHGQMLSGAHAIQAAPTEGNRPKELLGFCVPQALEQELAMLDLEQLTVAPAEKALLVGSRLDERQHRLGGHLRSLGVAVELQETSERPPWIWVEDVAQATLPVQTLRNIESWIRTTLE